jgi:hypothetical protein
MTAYDTEFHSYTKRYERLTGLSKGKALKQGKGVTTLETATTLTRWYWTVKATPTRRVVIRVTRTVFPLNRLDRIDPKGTQNG